MNPISPAATTALIIAGAAAAVGTVLVLVTRKSDAASTPAPPAKQPTLPQQPSTPPAPPAPRPPAQEQATTPAATITVDAVPTTTFETGKNYVMGAEASTTVSQAALEQQGWTVNFKPGDAVEKWPAALPYPTDPSKLATMFAATGTWQGPTIAVPTNVIAVRKLATPDTVDAATQGPFEGVLYRGAVITIDQGQGGYWIASATGAGAGTPSVGRSRTEVLEKLKRRIDAVSGDIVGGGIPHPLWWSVSWESPYGGWQAPVYEGYDEQAAHAAAAPYAARGNNVGAWVYDPASARWTYQPWQM